jgi:putative copper resistance protein D
MTTVLFILIRAVHFGACLVLFGALAFDRLVAVAEPQRSAAALAGSRARLRWISGLTLPVILLSGLAWFVLVAMSMSGQTPDRQILLTVWRQTLFGAVCHWRLAFWGATAGMATVLEFCSLPPSPRNLLTWPELAGSALLLGSLAWCGHGIEGQPAYGHLTADVVHLLAAGIWPAGLLPMAMRLRELCRDNEPDGAINRAALVRRFSAISLIAVGVLAGSGFVNSWFLVGSWENLLERPYGQWLLIKIGLFAVAVALGAVNLLSLKPRLSAVQTSTLEQERAATALRRNVWVELGLGMLIVMLVAVLGLLPPAAG